MTVTLVCATRGRQAEVERFLKSVSGSRTDSTIRIVLVDQNPDDRLGRVIEEFGDKLTIERVRTEPGKSRALNIALQGVKADIVGFPDDDCWYLPNTVERVADFFACHPEVAGLTGICVDANGKMSNVARLETQAGWVNRRNVWRRCTAAAMFLRQEAVVAVGGFDETLGVGASTPWRSGEEIDYVLRAIQQGFTVWYDPTLVVGHPNPVVRYDEGARRRALNYGRGMGRVLRKHGAGFSYFVARALVRPLGGAVLFLLAARWARARYHWCVFLGRLEGWFDRTPFA
jgi:GT2 family glycosyltransferase